LVGGVTTPGNSKKKTKLDCLAAGETNDQGLNLEDEGK